jgi:hypothetical protein
MASVKMSRVALFCSGGLGPGVMRFALDFAWVRSCVGCDKLLQYCHTTFRYMRYMPRRVFHPGALTSMSTTRRSPRPRYTDDFKGEKRELDAPDSSQTVG